MQFLCPTECDDRQNVTRMTSGALGQPLRTISEIMGLGSTSSFVQPPMGRNTPRITCTGETPNNLPTLSFHHVHGRFVRLSRDRSTIIKDAPLFSRALHEWFAFSARPVRLNEKVCIRFVTQPCESWKVGGACFKFGFTARDPATDPRREISHTWLKTLRERFCKEDNILYYYFNSAGDVRVGINGEEIKIFSNSVDARNTLWSVVDIEYLGLGTGIQYEGARAPNQIRRSLPSSQPDNNEESLPHCFTSLSIDESLPPVRFQSQAVVPLAFHRTKGRNVLYISDSGVAARDEAEICQGYVFTADPMRLEQTLVVQILESKPAYPGSLAFGLTSSDPATLRTSDLPGDAEQLLERPEYWVMRSDAANGLSRGDELAVTLHLDGRVIVKKNLSDPTTIMHVDHTVRLWAFVDICGATQKVRILSSQLPEQAQTSPPPHQSSSAAPINTGTGFQGLQDMTTQPSSSCIQVPPYQQTAPVQRPRNDAQCSSSQSSQNEQVIPPNIVSNEQPDPPIHLDGAECTICCENPKDSVLYKCGHMCMCYGCAVQQRLVNGHCPLCRAIIEDVIRTYNS